MSDNASREQFLQELCNGEGTGAQIADWLDYFPLTSYFPSANEIRNLSRGYVRGIFDAWLFVHDIVIRHEETIRNRWHQKTTDERRELLLQAWPNMPEHHRPDHHLFYDKPGAIEDFRHRHDELIRCFNTTTCMLPHINQEDLVGSKPLLILLNARGRNTPDKFAHAEFVHCPLGHWSAEALWTRLEGYTMAFSGRTDAETYGIMEHWLYKPDAVRFVNSGRGLHPGHGVQVLKIQFATYDFLQKFCISILRDISKNDLASSLYPVVPEPSDPAQDETHYNSVGDATLEAPYRVPGDMNFSRLRGLISSRISELEDHVWTLREDPSYFAEVFESYKSHRPEYARDTKGQKTPAARKSSEGILRYVVRDVVIDGYFMLYHWHECHRLLVVLEAMAKKYAPDIDPEEDLPEEYARVFQKLWKVLQCIMIDVHWNVTKGLFMSPPLRHLFYVPHEKNWMSDRVPFEPNLEEINKHDITKRFYRLVSSIERPQDPPPSGFRLELDELERLTSNEPAAKALISSYIASFLSQLSFASQCIQQLRLYQPWATKLEHDMKVFEHELNEYYFKLTEKWPKSIMQSRIERIALVSLADPSDGKFDYPVTQRRCRTNVRKLRAAEANLDRFWKEVDMYCMEHEKTTLPRLLGYDVAKGRPIQRTAPWINPPKARKAKVQSVPVQPEYIYQPFSLLDHDPTGEITGTFDKLSVSNNAKIKTKAKLDASHTEAQMTDILSASTSVAIPERSEPLPEYFVDKRSHNVFKALFHTPVAGDVPSDISWTDFLHAIVSMGFRAEKMHGSAWHFTPMHLDVDKSITFHEPHPSSKLPLIWARRIGARLTRAYGWRGDMFKLA